MLLAVAAPKEAEAARAAFNAGAGPATPWTIQELDRRFDLVVTGVSKAAAAGGVAKVLDPARHGAVINIGIAGDLTGEGKPGDVVLATSCWLVDEGVRTPAGFETLGNLGFGPFAHGADVMACDSRIVAALSGLANRAGPVATVSTCAGTDELAARWRTAGVIAEAMEGAAVALTAQRVGVPMAEIRVISNTTGDRQNQRWGLSLALSTLTHVLGRIRDLAG